MHFKATSSLLTEANRRLVVHVMSSVSQDRITDFFKGLPQKNLRNAANYLRRVSPVCLCARPNGITRVPTERIIMKLNEFSIFRKSIEEIQVSLKSDKISGYFVRRSMYISRLVLLRMKNSVPN